MKEMEFLSTKKKLDDEDGHENGASTGCPSRVLWVPLICLMALIFYTINRQYFEVNGCDPDWHYFICLCFW